MKQDHGVLLIARDRRLRAALCRTLVCQGYRVLETTSGLQALELIKCEAVQVALFDLNPPSVEGFELAGRMKQQAPGIEVVVIAGRRALLPAREMADPHSYELLPRPVRRHDLLRVIAHLIDKQALTQENRALREQLRDSLCTDYFVGKSRVVRDLIEMVCRVAPLQAAVLLSGETGTGKRALARLIHAQSARAYRRFVEVNCASMARELLRGALCGRVCPNRPGARRGTPGLFEQASGGTLFLDEVGAMPLEMQARLLRVMEAHEIFPEGATRPVPVDVRIVAATTQDLQRLCVEARFRDDLYYRLTLVQLHLPPLRQRREDIPALVAHFVKHHNLTLGKKVSGITPEALTLLLHDEWKGNVRELHNVIERAMILCEEEKVGLQHLPQNLALLAAEQHSPDLRAAVQNYERLHIQRVLAEVNHDKHAAASRLGLSLSSLYRKLAELELESRLDG